MILHVESDTSYLSEPKARARAAGYFYLSNHVTDKHTQPMMNGRLHVICIILKEVCASAAETELGSIFRSGKETIPITHTLEVLKHSQPKEGVRIVTDNSTAAGIANNTVKQKRSKAFDMRYYWIRDRAAQGQFRIVWQGGRHNLLDKLRAVGSFH
jgi:hypothetical protein